MSSCYNSNGSRSGELLEETKAAATAATAAGVVEFCNPGVPECNGSRSSRVLECWSVGVLDYLCTHLADVAMMRAGLCNFGRSIGGGEKL